VPTLKEQANALTPGDWSSLRDLIREMADTVDKLKAKPGRGTDDASGGGTTPPRSAPVASNKP